MKSILGTNDRGVRRLFATSAKLARAAVFAAALQMPCLAARADTLLWYRFDGDGATIENKAAPGTMDGTLKSINTWGSLGGLGDTAEKFPTRGDAFPDGTRLIDPATDTIHSETVKSLSFSGDPANSGTVRLLKADTTAALKEIIAQVGATSPQDMGKVMGVATKQLAGKAEGKAINLKVRELLAQ